MDAQDASKINNNKNSLSLSSKERKSSCDGCVVSKNHGGWLAKGINCVLNDKKLDCLR